MASETWRVVELPVLEAIAAAAPGLATSDDVQQATGLDRDVMRRALSDLAESGHLQGEYSQYAAFWRSLRLTERGKQAIGVWPADAAASALLELLQRKVDEAHDDEERGRWRRALDSVRGLGGRTLEQLLVEYLKQIGAGPLA